MHVRDAEPFTQESDERVEGLHASLADQRAQHTLQLEHSAGRHGAGHASLHGGRHEGVLGARVREQWYAAEPFAHAKGGQRPPPVIELGGRRRRRRLRPVWHQPDVVG